MKRNRTPSIALKKSALTVEPETVLHIVTTHKQTDFDALASTIAVTLLHPGAVGVVPAATNRNVEQFLSTHKTAFPLVLPGEVDFQAVTELTVVDTNQWHRLDRMDKLKTRNDLQINLWDHHMSSPGDIAANWRCQKKIGATISLLAKELEKRRIDISPLDSTVMLLGLYEDTGHLSYPSTTADDARAAAFLLENGADLNVAHFFLNPPYEKGQQEALFAMMQETEQVEINGLTIGFTLLQIDHKIPELATVVQLCRRVMGIDALFVLLDLGDRHTVIGRSSAETIHIGKIMKSLGGGGHPGAGSASIKNRKQGPQESIKQIEKLLHDNLQRGAIIADLMSFPVISITPDTPMYRVQDIMEEKNVRGLLVMEDDEICGIIVLWDLKKIKKQRQWQSPVKAFMSRQVECISPEMSPAEVTKTIMEKEVGYLPVVQGGKVIGIVTRTDLLSFYYNLQPPQTI